MSRIGSKKIEIPSGVTVQLNGASINVKGVKGNLTYDAPPSIKVEQKDNNIICTRENELRKNKALHGLVRSLINNMIIGVDKGFSKSLEINGVGYRAKMEGTNLVMNLGFSHPINHSVPKDIKAEVKGNVITVSGIDKQKVGQVAADIRDYYPPEPYKGKGIRYVGEYVRRKAGKTVGKK